MDRDLARRAVACKGWRWLPGMTYWIDPWRADRFDHCLPDLTDPCTLGGLLALVREAWGAECYTLLDSAWGVYRRAGRYGHDSSDTIAWGDEGYATEVEALVAALEAAP